jgi:alpha-galactosidase
MTWKRFSFELLGRDPGGEWSEVGYFDAPAVPTSGWIEQGRGAGAGESSHVTVRMETRETGAEQVQSWRLAIENRSMASIRLSWIALAHMIPWPGGDLESGTPTPEEIPADPPGASEYLHNGWQSWSYSGWQQLSSPMPRTRLGPFTRPMQEVQGFPSGRAWRDQAYSEMFTIVRDPGIRCGLVAGFLSEAQAFGRIYLQRNASALKLSFVNALDDIVLDPGESFLTDWTWLSKMSVDPVGVVEAYIQEVGERNKARIDGSTPVGWCSWYQLYARVTQSDVHKHAAWASSNQHLLPLNLIQIDDGYQALVGDWNSRKPAFTDEMDTLSASIRQSGREPGLWLAPFLADRRSALLEQHPDWVLKQPDGALVNPGWGWNGFPRVLDITRPEVLEFLGETVRRATEDWGYRYLKLDFLYAGALPGVYSLPHVTRAQALKNALQRMREAAGEDVMLLGCGCPLGVGIGAFDAMRIGPDVAPSWKPRLGPLTRWVHEDPGLPSTRNAIRNTILRAGLHRRWWINDPDCLLLRDFQTNLSDAEVKSLCSAIGLSGGSAIFSDVMTALTRERLSWGGRMVPPLELNPGTFRTDQQGSIHALSVDLKGAAGRWTLLGVFNLGDRIGKYTLNRVPSDRVLGNLFHCVDFWDQSHTILGLEGHDGWSIPPHSVMCVALRKHESTPQWLGGNLHFSQGQEISAWECDGVEVNAQIGFDGRELSGSFWVAFPGRLERAELAENDIRFEMIQTGVYKFNARVHGVQRLHFAWSAKSR